MTAIPGMVVGVFAVCVVGTVVFYSWWRSFFSSVVFFNAFTEFWGTNYLELVQGGVLGLERG